MKRLVLLVVANVLLLAYTNAQLDTSSVINSRLFDAILNNDKDSVQYWIARGADVNATNIYGITPLMYAVDNGNYDLCSLLIAHGANINYLPPYDPPAVSAAVIRNADTVLELLLKKGANPDLKDNNGYTPLAYAIYFGNYRGADLLLYYGADPDKSFNNWFPLQLASYYDDTLLVNMLLYYGANVDKRDSLGFTSLHVSAQQNAVLTTGILVDSGANLNVVNADHATPVALAVYNRSNGVVKELLDNGADLNVPVNDGFYPETIAVLVQNYKAKKLISKYGDGKFQLAFNFIAGGEALVNTSDFFTGVQIGVKELVTNIDVSFFMLSRLAQKRVFFQSTDNSYEQLWEQRWFLGAKAIKNFYVFSYKRTNFYANAGIFSSYTYATYSGTLLNFSRFFVTPQLGMSFDVNNFIFSFDFQWTDLEGLNNFPVFLNLSVQFKISPYKLNLSQKRFYLKNEAIF